MNPSTFIGIFAGIAVLGSVFYFSAEDPMLFVNLEGLGIVLGGTLAATFIAFPLKEVGRITSLFGTVMRNEKLDVQKDIEELVYVSRLWVSGKMRATEDQLEKINSPFLRSGLTMVLDMAPYEDIVSFLRWRISRMQAKEHAEAHMFRIMAGFAPAFGMIGTLVGLINMMFILGDGDMSIIGMQLAIALMTTFYGVLLANLVFKPVAVKLERRTEQRVIVMNMVMQGVLMLQQKRSPYFIEETLKSFVATYEDEIWDSASTPEVNIPKDHKLGEASGA